MKSPFPGMDPFIEGHGHLWEDFHHHLIEEIARAIAPALPDSYLVRAERRAYVVLADSEGKEELQFQGDVTVSSTETSTRQSTITAERVVVAEPDTGQEPRTLRAFVPAEYRESFIEIYEAQPERHLVTTIEVLSPSNKRKNTTGWKLYLRKRQGLLLGEANLVEIDLLRGGTRMPMLDPWPTSPYTLLVARSERAPSCKVWSAHFRSPLPPIPVPLNSPDPDITLDLQPLIEAIYSRFRYFRDIDYTRPIQPPLSEDDVTWLAQRVQGRA